MGLNNTEDVNLTDFLDHQDINDELNYDDLFTVYKVLYRVVFILNICGIFENVAICWILVRNKKCFKSFSNFHLLNLAITDILFRVIFTSYVLPDEMGTGDAKCKVAEFGIYTTLAVTFSLLAGIAFDRYIHIVHPFAARRITWKHSRNLVAVSWIYGAVCSAPFLYSTRGTVDINEALEKMWTCYQVPGLPFKISMTVFLGCSFLIPLIFMGFAYGKLLRVLWKRARTKVMNPRVANPKIRAVKMMVLVVLTYFITWGPHLIWKTMGAFPYDHQSMFGEVEYEEDDFSGQLSSDELREKLRQVVREQEKKLVTYHLFSMIFETMTFFSSVLNPLIFGYYNRSFREEVKTILCRNKCVQCLKRCKQEVCPNLGKRRGLTLDLNETVEANFQTTHL